MTKASKLALWALFALAGPVLLAETGLRLAGKPTGEYRYFYLESPGHLYPPSETISMGFGPVDYVMKTNSLGMRGPEIAAGKPPGAFRLMALGDSMTDGFFADDADTYPRLLEGELKRRGVRAEVANAASGAASIDKEYAVLRAYADRLRPDAALLLFCTNDIQDIAGRAPERLRALRLPAALPAGYALERALVTRTALGEALFGLKLRLSYPSYRASGERKRAHGGGRYEIEGGGNFEENVRIFRQRFAATEGPVDTEDWTPDVEAAVRNYAALLEEAERYARGKGIRFLFAYLPSYPQIYDDAASLRLRDELEAACRNAGIPFLDLTPAFRAAKGVMHLAPLDYHLNPAGNRLVAGEVAGFLEKEGVLY